jgi:hypothetical protein
MSKKTVMIQVKVSEGMKDALQAKADSLHMTDNDYIRSVLRDSLGLNTASQTGKPYAITLNGRIVTRFDSYEDARKYLDNCKREASPCLGLEWALVNLK